MIDKLHIKLNASGLSTMSCMLKWYRTCVIGYKTSKSTDRLAYGIGVHKYVETMYSTKGNIGLARTRALEAFNVPKSVDPKSQHLSDERHFIVNCFQLWDNWIMKDSSVDTILLPNDMPAVELSFSLPYYEDDYIYVTLEGTIDRLMKFKKGIVVINDFKTTSSWDKTKYLKQYAMSAQLRFYVFALKLMAEMQPDSLLGQIGAGQIGACIDGVFLKPKATDTTYARSDVYQFNDLDEMRAALDHTVQRISEFVKSNNTPYKEGILNGACYGTKYPCQYIGACMTGNSDIEKMILERDFIVKPYDPLHHQE